MLKIDGDGVAADTDYSNIGNDGGCSQFVAPLGECPEAGRRDIGGVRMFVLGIGECSDHLGVTVEPDRSGAGIELTVATKPIEADDTPVEELTGRWTPSSRGQGSASSDRPRHRDRRRADGGPGPVDLQELAALVAHTLGPEGRLAEIKVFTPADVVWPLTRPFSGVTPPNSAGSLTPWWPPPKRPR